MTSNWKWTLVSAAFLIGRAGAGEIPLIPVLKGSLESEVAPHGLGNCYAPSVRIENGTWRMWYGAQGKDGHDRIHLAESSDGVRWKKLGVVLDRGSAIHVNDPCVLRRGDELWMYYTVAVGQGRDSIHLAKSRDGSRWETVGLVLGPGPEGAWDSLSVGRPSVLVRGDTLMLWYDGRSDYPTDAAPAKDVPTSPDSRRSVGLATSLDGVRWTRHPQPVLGEDAGAVDVTRFDGHFLMLIESTLGTRVSTSTDGISWSETGLFLWKTYEPIDASGHVTPTLVSDPASGMSHVYVGAAARPSWDNNSIARFSVATVAITTRLQAESEKEE